MCDRTKSRIADCVKRQVSGREISKITIQDIMDELSMSRQSFYYHFKDIYDVLEWIGRNEFVPEKRDLREYLIEISEIIRNNRGFCESMVTEVPWPSILSCIREPMDEIMEKRISQKSMVDFLVASFWYYLFDTVYQRKKVDCEILLKCYCLKKQ